MGRAVVNKDSAKEVEVVSGKEFSIFDKYGKFVRVYSIDVHGEDAESMASGFAKKIGGSVK